MSIKANFSIVSPSIVMDFANSKTLDPNITFTRTTTGTYVGANGLIKTAGINEARFDHDPETGESLGLLIEESRTNFITYSDDFSQGYWQKFDNGLIQTNQAKSPDGTNTADKLYQTASGSTGHVVSSLMSTTAGTVFTGSVFIKADTFNNPIFAINFRNNVGGSLGYFGRKIDLTNGSVSTGFSVPDSFSVTDFGNGWYKLTVTQAAPANTTTVRLFIRLETTAANAAVFIWGAQLEEGGWPTSYIPTSGSTVTRAADAAEITGTNFSDFYNQNEGTVFAVAEAPDAYNIVVASLSNGTNDNKIEFRSSASELTKARAVIRTAGTVVLDKSPTAKTGRFRTLAFGVKPNDSRFSVDGTLSSVDTAVTLPSVSRLYLGNEFNSTNRRPGLIKRLTYYAQRLSDSQLQNLTK